MEIDVNYVLERLSSRQIESGGYYGAEVTELSKELGVTPQGLRKQIAGWKRSIKEFRDLRYLGKRPPSVTLTEFIENLKAYGGADLQEIFNRLINAKRHIEKGESINR
jgi:hypothetical protein